MQITVTPARLFNATTRVFGDCHSRTEYVWRWNLGPGLDLAIERRGSGGKLWLPWAGEDLGFGRRRQPGDRVNSNVYHKAPSLARGDLLELPTTTDAQLTLVLAYVRSLVELPLKDAC
jgi:hypothetical protein